MWDMPLMRGRFGSSAARMAEIRHEKRRKAASRFVNRFTESRPRYQSCSHRANRDYEIICRHIADVFDTVLVVRSSERGRAGAKLVLLSIDRDFHRAFADQPELVVLVPVWRMG